MSNCERHRDEHRAVHGDVSDEVDVRPAVLRPKVEQDDCGKAAGKHQEVQEQTAVGFGQQRG